MPIVTEQTIRVLRFNAVCRDRALQDMRKVVALILHIVPHIVEPVDVFYCLVAGPTLMCALQIMILYIVDQVQFQTETYYVWIELIITLSAFIHLIRAGKLSGAIYGLFYLDLLIAFAMDIYYMKKERGWTF